MLGRVDVSWFGDTLWRWDAIVLPLVRFGISRGVASSRHALRQVAIPGRRAQAVVDVGFHSGSFVDMSSHVFRKHD